MFFLRVSSLYILNKQPKNISHEHSNQKLRWIVAKLSGDCLSSSLSLIRENNPLNSNKIPFIVSSCWQSSQHALLLSKKTERSLLLILLIVETVSNKSRKNGFFVVWLGEFLFSCSISIHPHLEDNFIHPLKTRLKSFQVDNRIIRVSPLFFAFNSINNKNKRGSSSPGSISKNSGEIVDK